MLVIYARSVLNINVSSGAIQNAGSFKVTVLDHDPNGGINKSNELITKVIEQTDDTAEGDLSPVA